MSPIPLTALDSEEVTMGSKPNTNAQHYTHWEHSENGEKFVRHILLMLVLDAWGGVHILTGLRLPRVVSSNAGQGHKDAHSAHIVFRFRNPVAFRAAPVAMGRWLTLRDVANVLVGFMAVSLLRVIITLIEAL
jgi:hypothetical protein